MIDNPFGLRMAVSYPPGTVIEVVSVAFDGEFNDRHEKTSGRATSSPPDD